jgi:hypothetical protein
MRPLQSRLISYTYRRFTEFRRIVAPSHRRIVDIPSIDQRILSSYAMSKDLYRTQSPERLSLLSFPSRNTCPAFSSIAHQF